MNVQKQLSEKMAVMHAKHGRALVKPVENKRALRDEVGRQVAEFLANGGKIELLAPPCPAAPKQPDQYSVSINGIEYLALSIEGAAKRAGITRGQLRSAIARGEGPIWQKQHGGKRMVLLPIPQLDAWIERRKENLG